MHPGGFEPPTARFVAEYSIQLSYGCIGKLTLLQILILLLKLYQVRWCIREDDLPCGSPFGPLLKQRYPPWCLRLIPPPHPHLVAEDMENMVHPGGFEPPTARFVAEYSIQLSYGCKMAVRRGFEPRMQLLTAYSLSRGAPSASRPPHHTPLTSASKNLFLLFVAAMAHILLSGTYKSNLFSRPFFRLHTSRSISL